MHGTSLRLLLPLALVAALNACSTEDPAVDNEAEQEAALVAAQQAAAAAAEPPVAAPAPVAACDASQVQGLVGQAVDDATAEQARVDAGAASVRVLTPGQVVTMEFDESRLNLEVDEENVIVAVRCG